MKIEIKDYKTTRIYQNKAAREQIKRYRETYNLNNETLYLELYLYDLKHIDKSIALKANSGAALTAALLGLSFVALANNENVNRYALLANAILFIIAMIIYLSGISSQFERDKRAIRKLLKKKGYANVPEFQIETNKAE